MEVAEFESRLHNEGFAHTYVWRDDPERFYPDHTHNGVTAHVILEGQMILTMNGKSETYYAGDRCDVPAGVVHSALIGPHGCRYLIGRNSRISMLRMAKFSQPRPLAAAELAPLDFLLSKDFPGRDELKAQTDSVEVVGECDCGCGTVDLAVEPAAPRSLCREPIPVEAYNSKIEVLLFVRRGMLSSLEIVNCYRKEQDVYPRPDDVTLWAWPGKGPTDSSA